MWSRSPTTRQRPDRRAPPRLIEDMRSKPGRFKPGAKLEIYVPIHDGALQAKVGFLTED